MDKRISTVVTSVIDRRHGGLIWPVFLYGARPWLYAARLLRLRPQPADNPYQEPDPIA